MDILNYIISHSWLKTISSWILFFAFLYLIHVIFEIIHDFRALLVSIKSELELANSKLERIKELMVYQQMNKG